MFDSYVGWPGGQQKLGDYYDMISDNTVANVAYAATFNGEQDIYFLRVGDCNDNALLDECELGDADGNERINLRDFADFANCYTGSTEPARARGGAYVSLRRESARAEARGSGVYGDRCCGIVDFDTDGDIDLTDFAALHEAFSSSE